MVADFDERKMFVYEAETGALLAASDDLSLDDYAGFLSLPDGRLIFIEPESGELGTAHEPPARTPAASSRTSCCRTRSST